MISDITVCIPTLTRYDLLKESIDSLLAGKSYPKNIVIINNGVEEFSYKDVDVYSFGRNLGVATSWNWFIENVEMPILICNDDIIFGEEDLLSFEIAYNNSPLTTGLFFANNIPSLNVFSCFMPTKWCIEKVGLFDQNFYPAYFEDNDYFYRMILNNVNWQGISTNLKHVGSATLNSFSVERRNEHHAQFRKNKDYYIKKWGGTPGQETYRSPYGK